jgi:Na+/proline symporter
MGISDYLGLPGRFWAALLMITLAMIYTVVSGLQGVVWTDVFQGLLILGVIVYICIKAFLFFQLPDAFQVSIPLKEGGFDVWHTTKKMWASVVPKVQAGFPENSTYSIFNLFLFVVVFYLIKTVISGFGPAGNYMAQRFFAAKSDREACLAAGLWTFLLGFRWPFIAGIAVIGIVHGMTHGVIQDPEMVLPVVINTYLPVGLKGLFIACLIAAAMSTFDSTVNATAAYWVKDIYRTYIRPNADEKASVQQARIFSIVLVALGLVISLFARDIQDLWGFITMGLGSGLLMPMVVMLYWSRMNGYGFAISTAIGIVGAIVIKILFPFWPEYVTFLVLSSISLASLVVFTLITAPTPHGVTRDFYLKVRPFGLWGPVKKELVPEEKGKITKENRRDLLALGFALPWQLCFFISLMLLVVKAWGAFLIMGSLTAGLTVCLYFAWYRRLQIKSGG